MPLPTHPHIKILKNMYYPSGLSESQIWTHYIKHKQLILSEINNRNCLLFIIPNKNNWIIKRNYNGKPIKLTSVTYDRILSGRTISISVEQSNIIDYICIDIDAGPNVSEARLKLAVDDIRNSPLSVLANNIRVTNSATGYHVYFYLKKKQQIQTAHKISKQILSMEFGDRYIVSGKVPKSTEVKLDLSPTTYRGSHTVCGALCRNGLICSDVSFNLNRFKRSHVIVN